MINDQSNAFERTTKGSINTSNNAIPDINGFKYRGDGRDVFFLEILPIEGVQRQKLKWGFYN